MKLYNELAEWWHLLSAPEDYKEEADLFWEVICRYKSTIKTALELGSGGGNNAFYLKKHCQMTLTDLSPHMIAVSKKINPECEHIVCDMRKVALDHQFDLVFIHDAITYMTTEQDLLKVFETAYKHLKADGLLFIIPDAFTETFKPDTHQGGHDGEKGSIRYLEWIADKDPSDHLVEVDYVYIIKDDQGQVQTAHDSSVYGLFDQKTWQNLLNQVGFEVFFEPLEHSELAPGSYIGIACLKKES